MAFLSSVMSHRIAPRRLVKVRPMDPLLREESDPLSSDGLAAGAEIVSKSGWCQVRLHLARRWKFGSRNSDDRATPELLGGGAEEPFEVGGQCFAAHTG